MMSVSSNSSNRYKDKLQNGWNSTQLNTDAFEDIQQKEKKKSIAQIATGAFVSVGMCVCGGGGGVVSGRVRRRGGVVAIVLATSLRPSLLWH